MQSCAPRYIRSGDEIRGPFSTEQLRQLAEVEVVTPATEVAFSQSGPWSKLELATDAATLFPKRREFAFKPATFAAVNPPRPPAPQPGDPPSPAPPNDVVQMVESMAKYDSANTAPLVLPKKKWLTRRFKFLLGAAIAGDVLVALLPLAYDGAYDATTVAILGGWMILYDGGLLLFYIQAP